MLRQAQARTLMAVFPTLEARLTALRRAALVPTTGCAECGGEGDDAASEADTEAHEACDKSEAKADEEEKGCGCETTA